MASRLWFDELQERLAAHELPPAYVRRFVRELADHFRRSQGGADEYGSGCIVAAW